MPHFSHIKIKNSSMITDNSNHTPQDPFPLGEIIIGAETEGFSLDEMAPIELGGGENAFVLNTPTRTYPLLAETAEEKHSWLAVLRAAVERANNAPNGHSINGTYNISPE